MKRIIAFTLVLALALGSSFGAAATNKVLADEYTEADIMPIDLDYDDDFPILISPNPIVVNDFADEDDDTLKNVILAVKQKLELDDAVYTVFDQPSSWMRAGETMYSLSWNDDSYEKMVSCEADSQGRIQSVYYYFSMNNRVPELLRAEAQPIADELLVRLFPEVKGHTELASFYYRSWNCAYVFTYQHLENGIPMPDNTISITISAEDGALLSANANWDYTLDIPSAKKLIGEAKAKKIMGKELTMKLSYMIMTTYENGERSSKAILCYKPSHSYIAVDAKTGEIYESKASGGYMSGGGFVDDAVENETSNADKGEGYVAVLTDAELAGIVEINNLLTKNEAAKIVTDNPALLFEEGIKIEYAYLENINDRYVWSIRWRDNKEPDWNTKDVDYYPYQAYAYATIDAATGEILSYYSSLKSSWNYKRSELEAIKMPYSEEDCQKAFEEFAKAQNEERFAQTVLDDCSEDDFFYYDDDSEAVRSYRLDYNRYSSGISVENNYIYGAVDKVSGKIYSYGYHFDDVEFSDPTDKISDADALKAYLSLDGFRLKYELGTSYNYENDEWSYSIEKYVRLVYAAENMPAIIDAYTGKQINRDGSEYIVVNSEYAYTDIEDSEYCKYIQLLADMGIGFDSSEYEPEKAITRAEFTGMLNKLPRVYGATVLKSDAKLTRRVAAKALVSAMGYEQIGQLDIFKTGYSDEKKIGKNYIGYVALAKGLGVMEAKSGNKFAPTATISRGEAAKLLVDFLKNVNK